MLLKETKKNMEEHKEQILYLKNLKLRSIPKKWELSFLIQLRIHFLANLMVDKLSIFLQLDLKNLIGLN